MTKRRTGIILSFFPSNHGGWGHVLSTDQPDQPALFFLHKTCVARGTPEVGAEVTFSVIPAAEGAAYPKAVGAVIKPKGNRR